MTSAPMEREITQAIRLHLVKRGAFCFKVHGGAFQMAGIPDLIGCIDGRFFGLEVKRPGGRATALQSAILRRIEQAGGIAAVVTSVAEAEAALTEKGD